MLDDAIVQLEVARLEHLTAARMATIKDWHVVLLSHGIHRVEKALEVLLGVDVLFAVGAQENVAALLKAELRVDVGRLDLGKVRAKDLRHRRARDVRALLREPAIGKITPRVLRVSQIHVRDDIHDAAVCLLGQTLVLATVARLHVEDRDMQPLGPDDGKTRVRVAQDHNGIRLNLNHQVVTRRNDVPHRVAEGLPHGVEVHLRVVEFQVVEEHTVEIVIVILPRVGENAIEVLAALLDDLGEADDLGARAHDDQQLQPPVVLERYVVRHCLHLLVKRVRMLGVEHLVAGHDRHQVFGFAQVRYVVGPTGDHVDGLDFVAADLELDRLAGADAALLDPRAALNNDEELPFGVVPMLTLRDAGLADVDRDLAAIFGVNKLGEASAVVDVRLERVLEHVLGEVR